MFNIKIRLFKSTILTFLLSLSLSVSATDGHEKLSAKLQNRLLTTKAGEPVTLFIYFKDKGSNIDEKLLTAKAGLSPLSLKRRLINLGAENLVSEADIPVSPDYINKIKPQVSKVRHQLKVLNAVSVEATPAAIEKISKFEFVERVELVNTLKRNPEPRVVSNIVQTKSQSAKSNNPQALDYGASFTQNNQINVPAVHEMGYSGNGVIIAIFDSGFNRLSHQSFTQMAIAGTWDFVNDDNDVGDSSDMGVGSHGTNTLSTVGGFSSGNLIGPAYGATYYLAKTENTESELQVEEDNWCAAADWADVNGAQIITSSLGYTDFDSGDDNTPDDMDGDTNVITLCADLAAQKGIVVINSAGNDGAGSGKNTLGAPSDGHLVLAVGAVTASGSRSSFSSVGPSADGRIKPDVMAMGSSVLVASASSDDGYSSFNGTSFSCPLTAGVAALVLEANPDLTAVQVLDILRNSADKTAKPDNLYGYGLIDSLAAVEAAIQTSDGSIAPNASFAVINHDTTTSEFINTSTDSDGTIESYAWNFGDEEVSAVESPSHTFASDGTYTVSLTVTDNDGLDETISQDITVTTAVFLPTPVSSSSGGGSVGFIFVLSLLIFIVISPKKVKQYVHSFDHPV